MYKIVALYGQAGSGKDTILQTITKARYCPYHEIISCTTRPPREGEQDNINYHFCSEEEFFNKNFLEKADFREWHYGTAYENLDEEKINIGVFNIDGIKQLLEKENVEVLKVQVIARDKLRLLRQLYREENVDVKEIIRRFSTDEQDFANCPFEPDYICDNNVNSNLITICSNLAKVIDTRFGQNIENNT